MDNVLISTFRIWEGRISNLAANTILCRDFRTDETWRICRRRDTPGPPPSAVGRTGSDRLERRRAGRGRPTPGRRPCAPWGPAHPGTSSDSSGTAGPSAEDLDNKKIIGNQGKTTLQIGDHTKTRRYLGSEGHLLSQYSIIIFVQGYGSGSAPFSLLNPDPGGKNLRETLEKMQGNWYRGNCNFIFLNLC